MKSNAQYKPTHSVAILGVGEPKTGKSRLLMAFPTPGILDCDLNLNSAIRVAGAKEFFFAQPALNDDGTELKPELRWDKAVAETKTMLLDSRIKTVAIDGLGVLTNWLMDHIVHQNKLAGTNKSGKMELRDYGDVARLLRGFVMMLRSSGKIIYVSSHQQADKDELTGAMRYSLAIPGQSKETLGGLFTDVWATTATPQSGGKVKYEIRTKPTGFHVALGTSFDLPSAIDVTDKSPDEIWGTLSPKLSLNIQPTTK